MQTNPEQASKALDAAIARTVALPAPTPVTDVTAATKGTENNYDDYSDSVYVDAPYDDYQDK